VLLVPPSVLIEDADAVVLGVVRIRLETHGVADILEYHSVVRVSHRGEGVGLPVGIAGVVQPGGGVIQTFFMAKTILALI